MNFNFDLPEGVENMETQVIDESSIPNQGPGFMYDPTGNFENEDKPNLADTGRVLNGVQAILEYMCTDEVIELRNKDEVEYEKHMEEKFEDFCDRFYSIFKKVLSGEDITPLMGMLAEIEKVKRGDKTLEEAEQFVGEQLAQKYIYPKINK